MKKSKLPALLVSPMRRDANVEAVVAKIQHRADVGMLKYGVSTEREDIDLVGWLTHLQEELMDAAIYVQRILKETNENLRTENETRQSSQVFEDMVYQLREGKTGFTQIHP